MTRSIWDELKPGKLDERAHELAGRIAGGHRRGAEIYGLYRSRPYSPYVSRKPAFDKEGVRIFDAVFAKFTYIRRPYVERPDPPSVRAGKRLVLYAPTRPEVATIKEAGARRHRIHGVYTIPREKMTPELAKFTGSKAKTRFLRIVNRRAAPPSAAARFQRYIDGPIKPKDDKAGTRTEEVNGVPSLLGNIGTDRAERARSWTSFVAGLDRANARFQYRILLMLPPSFTPEERYAAVEEFARRLFEPKGIRWSAAIHRPVPRSTTDEATPHAHILFEPLGTDRMRELRKEEDRVYLRLGWPAKIKKAAAEAFNEVYWRKERRVGLDKGTPVFMTIEPAKRTGKPEANPRQWRHDEKQKTAGLPTVSQRKALLEPGAMPAWMSIDPILPTLEAIPGLLTVLVPCRQPHDPTIEKALGHLRSWAEKLIEKVLEEVRQTFEVATYLSLQLRTPHSELLKRVFEQFRGTDWQNSPDRHSYPTGFQELEYKKWREKRFSGETEHELAGTITAIEETEGRHFENVREMRRQLVAYHKIMMRALEARRLAIKALANTIRYLDSLTPQESSQSYQWWPYASMANSGVGAAFWFKEDERAI